MSTAVRSRAGQPPAWVTRLPSYVGLLVVLAAASILFGWFREFKMMLDVWPGLPAFKANAAVASLAAGASLLGGRSRSKHWRWLAVVPLLIGAATLLEWVGLSPVDIDQLLVDDPFADDHPGRPAPQMALALLSFGIARLTSGHPRRAVARVGATATAVLAVIVLVLVLGFAFQSPELTSAGSEAGMSLTSAACMALLGAGCLALHAGSRPLCYLWDDGVAGTVTRRMLPAVVLAPPVLGMLRFVGQHQGWYGLNLGISLFSGAMVVLLAVVVTVTARSIHTLEAEQRRTSRQLEAVFESVPAELTLRDQEGRFLRVNSRRTSSPVGRAAAGAPADDTEPSSLHDHDVEVLRDRRPVTHTYRVEEAGDVRDWEVTRFPVDDADGSVIGIGAFALDVTDRLRAEEALREAEQLARHLAEHDPLTGVWNRRRFERELDDVLAGHPVEGALMIVDVDHFKAVNDTAGHDAGDQLLVAVAAHLTPCGGGAASVSRLGGDEFAILLRSGDHTAVEQVAAEVVDAVCRAARSCDLGAAGSFVSASVGVAAFADLAPSERTPRAVMIRADEALYGAKRGGRGRFRMFETGIARGASPVA